jgi:hypothetical protein
MKKLLTIALALIMAFSLGAAPAFAEGGSISDPSLSQTDDTVQGATGTEQAIPVYGYVGEDAIGTDTKPGTAGNEPTWTPYEINVSVPTKIIWAAFESDKAKGNNITAPSYTITNNSEKNDLKVTLIGFTPGTGPDNTAIDTNLTLNITGMQMATSEVFKGGFGKNNVAFSGSVLTKRGGTTPQWSFSLDGKYSGASYATAYKPTYTMTLKFALNS